MRLVSRLVLVASLLLVGCRTARNWHVEQTSDDTARTLRDGKIVGGSGRYGSYAWLGIPFAAPPVGSLRWRAPQKPAPWKGTFAATEFGHACPQFGSPLASADAKLGEPTGSEDCLTLNVWAPPFGPSDVPQKKLPVMLWIHGGGNSLGSASFYDAGHLATSQNVIVVSAQYRLGPLGWFHHPALRGSSPEDASGNYGTLDLIAALEWVRDNASAFGGDPGNVTIFGESAGGLNTYSLLLSPRAKGLFHRAIVQSGGLWSFPVSEAENWTEDGGHKNSSNELLARLLIKSGLAKDRADAKAKISSMSPDEVEKFLRSQSAEALLSAYVGTRGMGMLDAPLVFSEGTVLPSNDWLTQLGTPDGWNQVPVIVGTNRDEMKLFLFLDPHRIWKRFWLFPRYVDEPRYHAVAEAMSRSWKLSGADEPASAMRRSGASNVFAYRFDWDDEPRIYGSDLSGMLGAAHGLEIPFVFGHFSSGPLSIVFPEETLASREQLSKAMMTYWGNFARTGTPGSAPGLAQWTAWSDDSPESPRYLVLDSQEGGGIHMASKAESRDDILALILNDPRLPTQRDRCMVFHELGSWGRGFSRDDYAKVGCATAFPFEQYPWDNSKVSAR